MILDDDDEEQEDIDGGDGVGGGAAFVATAAGADVAARERPIDEGADVTATPIGAEKLISKNGPWNEGTDF